MPITEVVILPRVSIPCSSTKEMSFVMTEVTFQILPSEKNPIGKRFILSPKVIRSRANISYPTPDWLMSVR